MAFMTFEEDINFQLIVMDLVKSKKLKEENIEDFKEELYLNIGIACDDALEDIESED